MKDIFDRYYIKYDNWYNLNKFAYLSELEAIKKLLPKKGRGLEIGVGTGRFAAPLGIEVGIDPSKNMIKIARQRGVDAKVASGEHLPFKDATFDYVAIIITICFLKDPLKVLREAGRVLKRNAKIVIGIIDKNSLLGKVYQGKKKAKNVFYKQADFFTVKEVVNLLDRAGFTKFSFYQTLFRLPGDIDSVEKPKKGFGKGSFVVISAQKS